MNTLPMSFLDPRAWMLAGLALLVVGFYFWRYPVTKEKTATFWLWERALARRPAWYALRFWLSLAAQVLVVLAMVAALAQPYWTEVVRSRRSIVLLVDVSASMSATDVAATRFEEMQEEARQIVAQLRRKERMAIVSVGSTVRSVCRFTDSRELLASSIEALRPTDGATRMTDAVRLARRMLEGKQNPRIVVLSDGGFPDVDQLAAAEDIQITVSGGEANNLAITRFASRPQTVDPEVRDVLVEVSNFAEGPAESVLQVGVRETATESTTLTLGAGQAQQITVAVPVTDGGLLEARLETDDDLAADNQSVASVRPLHRPHVELVSDLATVVDRQLQAALEADGRWDVAVRSELPSALPDRTVAVLHRQVPDQLPSCPVLVVNPQNACDLWGVSGVIEGESSAVGSVRSGSPLLDRVRFQDTVVEAAARLAFQDVQATTLVESVSGEPLYSLVPRPKADVLILHVNLQKEKSDLAMRTDFPILVSNAIGWLSRDPKPSTTSVTTEQTIEVPASDKPRQLKAQDGQAMELQPGQNRTVLDRAGVWTSSTGGEDASANLVLPSNLLNRLESDLTAGAHTPSQRFEATGDEAQPLWVPLVSVALLCLVLQWCLYHRRVVV
jgi:hypothetical protein